MSRDDLEDFFTQVTLTLTPTSDLAGVYSIELTVDDLENVTTDP